MEKVLQGFLERNLPQFIDCFNIDLKEGEVDNYTLTATDGKINIVATTPVMACNAIYDYLKKYCNLQLSWCGNTEINIKELTMFDGEMKKTVTQKFRVYMNYCTLNYTMSWWDFARWEKEIDFMAMNGINMPLAVVGTEAVLYETLQEFGFTKEEAMAEISGPAFYAWQLMTNIMGYMPPNDEKYIYERAELGKKLLERYLEFGMQPIQQGFSGHVPMRLKEKYPKAKILSQKGWCYYPQTAQIDPLDPLFTEFGTALLKNLEKIFGNYHYIACDPFHEGTPPKKWKWYLKKVGRTIDNMYRSFDEKSIWVVQCWTLRKEIITVVPKERTLVLDLNSEKTAKFKNMWGYPTISGMLHNFGGKNAMQGQLKRHSDNIYLRLKNGGADMRGTGMFMEGVEQNPVVYDLQFELLTAGEQLDFNKWLDNYIERRYGKYNPTLRKAWDILLETCYCNEGYRENEVGSCLASRPQMMPVMTGPCCYAKLWYDTKKFEKAVALFMSLAEEYKDNEGYQYDLCDLVRQALSNRFHDNQLEFSKKYDKKDLGAVKELAQKQLQILLDLDELTSHRTEMCLARWICDSHDLATDENEKKYFDLNARTLITSWGDIDGDTSALYDYSWREWSGLIKEYYYVRWQMFYDEAIKCLENGKKFVCLTGNNYFERKRYREFEFGKKLNEFELKWCKTYSEYERPENTDVIPSAVEYTEKWNIGK